jgi:hypothetical protein
MYLRNVNNTIYIHTVQRPKNGISNNNKPPWIISNESTSYSNQEEAEKRPHLKSRVGPTAVIQMIVKIKLSGLRPAIKLRPSGDLRYQPRSGNQCYSNEIYIFLGGGGVPRYFKMVMSLFLDLAVRNKMRNRFGRVY